MAESSEATVLHFPRRRGRPKIVREEKDHGTAELQAKRAESVTAEPLDLCLERGIITPEQHWCGIHLRWLYTLRHGAPGVRALDMDYIGGAENRQDDPQWRSAREEEYHDAMRLLSSKAFAMPVMNLCIHNEWPNFLANSDNNRHKDTLHRRLIIEGLDLLATHWRHPRRR